MVSSIGSVAYGTARELSRILRPLVGRSTHHVRNNQDFIQSIEEVKVGTEECMMSYDVKALFTSIPIQHTLSIIKKLLEEDTSLQQRTSMAVKHIYCLLEFCLTNTYFSFQGKLYEQKEGAAIGSPISPLWQISSWKILKTEPLPHHYALLKSGKRFVDGAFTVIRKDQKEVFLDHLNFIHNSIQFTSEDPSEDGSIPFLDMLVFPDEEGRLKTTVYRKQHTPINTCIGTAIMPYHPNTA